MPCGSCSDSYRLEIVVGLKSFVRYLLDKKSEVADLEFKDALLAKVVLDIHRKRTHKTVEFAPLYSIRPVHRLDRDAAIAKTAERVETLTKHRAALLEAGDIGCELLAEYLPSVSWIKVVQGASDEFIAFEGNGRLEALQRTFAPTDRIRVEVERYHFRNTGKIVRRLNRVRRANDLLEDAGNG